MAETIEVGVLRDSAVRADSQVLRNLCNLSSGAFTRVYLRLRVLGFAVVAIVTRPIDFISEIS